MEIPWSDGALDRFKQCVLADPMFVAPEHKCVIDFITRTLYPMRKPIDAVVPISLIIEVVYMIKPWLCLLASPGTRVGGRYKLKQLLPSRSTQPPSVTKRFWISMGIPGTHVCCSTDLFLSSHALAFPTMRALTLTAGQCSPVGVKI